MNENTQLEKVVLPQYTRHEVRLWEEWIPHNVNISRFEVDKSIDLYLKRAAESSESEKLNLVIHSVHDVVGHFFNHGTLKRA